MTPIRAALIFWVMAIVFLGGLGVFSLYEIVSVANSEMFLPPTNALLQKLIIIVCLTAVLISVQLALIFWAVCTQTNPQPAALSKEELYERAQELDIPGRSSMSKAQLVRALERAG